MSDGYKGPFDFPIEQIHKGLWPAKLMRVQLDEEAIERYRPLVRRNKMPPVKLMQDPKTKVFWVVDGAHTITATIREMGADADVLAVWKEGTLKEAFREARRANEEHGVPIYEADKRHAVEEFLRLKFDEGMKDPEIAEILNTTKQYVGQIRKRMNVSLVNTLPRKQSCDGLTPIQQKVADLYRDNPSVSVREAARLIGVDPKTIHNIRVKLGMVRPRSARTTMPNSPSEAEDEESSPGCTTPEPQTSAPQPETKPPPKANGEPTRETINEMFGQPTPTKETAEFDFDAEWEEDKRAIMAMFRAKPEDYRSSFVSCLRTLVARLEKESGWTNVVHVEVDPDEL